MGQVNYFKHDSKTLSGAFGITQDRFEVIIELAEKALEREGHSTSEKIAFLLERLHGAELVLGLFVFGKRCEAKEWEQ
jgi:hypothetical protein